MKKHTGTLTEIIEGEHNKTLNALNTYRENFAHNLSIFQLLENFLVEFNAPEDIFLRFYYSVRNFYLLTLFSIVRQHHVQSSLNLRQLIESGANAAYSIAFPDVNKFAKTDEFGIMNSSDKLKSKRYQWLSKNYPNTSNAILKIKKPVQFSSHSNIVDSNRGYRFLSSKQGAQVQVSYFDFQDEYMEKTSLWQLANTTLAIMGLWYEVSQNYKSIKVIPDFAEKHSELMNENQEIKEEFMKTKRFKKADILARMRESKRENNNT